jgi:hypothetical protein
MNLSWLVVGATIGAGLCTMIVDMVSMKLLLMFIVARRSDSRQIPARCRLPRIANSIPTGAVT